MAVLVVHLFPENVSFTLSESKRTLMSMKLLLLSLLLLSGSAHSQTEDTVKRSFILASMSFEWGRTQDRYTEIDLATMYDWTKNPAELDRDLAQHSVEYDRIVEGSRLGVSFSLIPYSKKISDYSTTQELRLGLFYSVRGTHLSYDFADTSGARQETNYSTRFKELSITGSYLWKYSPKFAERFTLYGGIGLGIGSTVYDKTSVAEHFSDGQLNEIPFSKFNVYEGKSSLFTRAFVPIGIDYALAERFDIGLTATAGMALQTVYGGENYLIPFSWSLAARFGYFF